MTVPELYDYITKHMTPEQALLKLLEGHVIEYEKLKFSQEETAIHPLILITMAAHDMGWNIMIQGGDDDEINGISVGTDEYIDKLFNNIDQ
jgi:hypothetical protein